MLLTEGKARGEATLQVRRLLEAKSQSQWARRANSGRTFSRRDESTLRLYVERRGGTHVPTLTVSTPINTCSITVKIMAFQVHKNSTHHSIQLKKNLGTLFIKLVPLGIHRNYELPLRCHD